MSNANTARLKKKAADFEQKKQYDRALSLYIQVLDESGRDLDDADLQLFNRVGDLLQRQGNVSEALAYYERAVDVYAERGFLNNAIALCNKILRQSPARTAVYYKLGKISANKGFKSDAKKNFLEYADRMQKGGHVDEAFRALKEFADLCPDQDDIRLMLAEWLTKENRKPEALEQLETLYNRLEAEGRTAEARATIDRMKAIDPDVVPRPSGAYISQKSKDLIFLDLNAEVASPRATQETASQAPVDGPATRTPESSRVPALDGLIITFDPDDDSDAAAGPAARTLDGFEATIDDGDVARAAADAPSEVLDGFERTDAGPEPVPNEATGETEAAGQSIFAQTVEAWGGVTEPVPPLEGLESPRASMSGAHPALAPLLDEPPMSGREFATLDLEVGPDAPAESARPRSEHDFALPSSLPLLLSDDASIDLLAVMSTPLSSAISSLDDHATSGDGIDLLSLPPIREVVDSLPRSERPVSGSHSPIDLDAMASGDADGGTARAIPMFDAEMLLDASGEQASVEASVEGAMAGTEPLVDLPDESHVEGADAASHAPEAMHAGEAETADAYGRAAERPRRDTAEFVAQDGSGRATDEILAVPSEIIDEETKRSLRLEFALHEEEAPDTWIEGVSPVPRDDLSTEPLAPSAETPPAESQSAETPTAETPSAERVDARDASEAAGTEDATPFDDAGLEGAAAAEVAEPARVEATESSNEVTAGTTAAGDGAPSIDDLESISDAEYTASGESRDINLLDELTPPFMREGAEAPATARADGAAARTEDAMASALDVQALRAVVEARDATEHAADGGERDDAAGTDVGDEPETSVELPLLEVEGPGEEETDLGIAPYNVEDDAPVSFLPEPDEGDDASSLDDGVDRETPTGAQGAADGADTAPPEEWAEDEVPEVLIDGEWHDEHMGDLVSGEVRAIRKRPEETPRRPTVRFDDLAAATLWVSPDGAAPGMTQGARFTPASGGAHYAHLHTPRSTLSLGGVEAQLRRRLELDPGNVELRRQLGETLLDQGDREAGFAELDAAMMSYEQEGNLDGARSVADVVLRVIPSSVRHHQKRVEYAVRSGDRVRLVEAYVELADALFRSGDPDKAGVVYGRVLDLAPGNERARFALGLLTSKEKATADAEMAEAPAEPAESSGSVAELFDRSTAPGADAAEEHAETSSDDSGMAETPAASSELADSVSGERPEAGRATPTLDEQIDAAFATPPGSEPAVAHGDAVLPPVAPHEATDSGHDASALAAGPVTERSSAGSADSSPAPMAAPRDLDTEGDFIDLGSWLREDVPARSTRMVTVEAPPTGNEQADFDEMLRRFKQGVAANVDEEDYASHYDLGVAYKEMGLVDEAIAEFQKSLRGETHRVRSYEALGQCFVEKGQLQVAVTLLRRALETTGADDQQLVGVLYLLGYASEVMAHHAEALGYYQRVFAIDIEFRDVAQRVAAMEQVTQ